LAPVILVMKNAIVINNRDIFWEELRSVLAKL